MKKGYLSEYFSGVAMKTLRAVEADTAKSNQHEFNGVAALKRLFGAAAATTRYYATFIYLADEESEVPVISEGYVSWYDARRAHATRSEYRLYFPETEVSVRAAPGDLLVIGTKQDGSVLVIIAEAGSTVANQVKWLFGFPDTPGDRFEVRAEEESDRVKIEFASRLILEQIGVVQEEVTDDHLETMLNEFNGMFPATRIFSKFARSTLPGLDPRQDPDAVLISWMDREEQLFRTLERHLVSKRLVTGFENDVDGFLSFSLSVQNRRKSRVGHALENHLQEIFECCEVMHDRACITENKSKPDFIFPGISNYQDPSFDTERLTMLGVKSTCKDRWRQVLAEADRIENKHLLTLEPSISVAQTSEMRDKKVTLVLPKGLHSTYSAEQQSWLLSLNDFIQLVLAKQ